MGEEDEEYPQFHGFTGDPLSWENLTRKLDDFNFSFGSGSDETFKMFFEGLKFPSESAPPPKPKKYKVKVQFKSGLRTIIMSEEEVNDLRRRADEWDDIEHQRKFREAQEEAERQWQEKVRQAREQQQGRQSSFNFNGTFGTGSGYSAPPPRPRISKPAGIPHHMIAHRLAEIAGVEVSGSTPKQLYRKAMAKAHPDAGGSKEKAQEVNELGRRLGII